MNRNPQRTLIYVDGWVPPIGMLVVYNVQELKY